MSGTGDTPSDLLRERADQSRAKLWLLLEADRWVVTGAILTVVFVALVGVGHLAPAAESAVRDGDSVATLFQALLTATITGVTLVLTLNQLVLSQELGAVGDQRERMEGATEFRRDAADAVGAPVSPSRPAQFLRALVEASADCAAELRDSVSTSTDEELKIAVDDLADGVTENADQVSEGLDNARFGSFEVISSALNFNYSWKLFESRHIREKYGDELNERGRAALERLIELLALFGPAREHFKTLYFQWELINLSRRILATAVPALLVSTVMIVFFDAAAYEGTVLGVDTLVLTVGAATAVSLVPFILLLAYILRIATVTKHTLSIGPFILREAEDVREVEWGR